MNDDISLPLDDIVSITKSGVVGSYTTIPTVTIADSADTATHHRIKGRMLTVKREIDKRTLETLSDGDVKAALIGALIDEMRNSGLVEFTKEDMVREDKVVVRARVFVTPNEDVQVLRKAGF